MSAKIIMVWGKSNSGKTTFAANLACALSQRDMLVGLVSSNLYYGDLQILFGEKVPLEKGLFQALNEDNPVIGDRFSGYGESKNLFYLSVPSLYTGLLCDTVTLSSVERVINDAVLIFDILIIDGDGQLANPISGAGLWLAERIYTLHRPSLAAQMWYQSVSDFVNELHIAAKQVHVLQAPNGEFCDKTYQSMTGLSFPYELPYIKQAAELENAGKPIYFFRDGACKRYRKVLDRITNDICGGIKVE